MMVELMVDKMADSKAVLRVGLKEYLRVDWKV